MHTLDDDCLLLMLKLPKTQGSVLRARLALAPQLFSDANLNGKIGKTCIRRGWPISAILRRAIFRKLLGLTLGYASAAVAAPDLQWDLSYQTALKTYQIASNEFMQTWVLRYPARVIHTKLAEYTGAPIQASVLIETPDSHTGDPLALWLIKTKTTAQLCQLHKKAPNQPCKELDVRKADTFVRQVLALPMPAPTPLPDGSAELGKTADGVPILFNYAGFLSVYLDGKVLQRPLTVREAPGLPLSSVATGSLQDLLAALLLPDADIQQRRTATAEQERVQALHVAAKTGDLPELRRLLARAPAGQTETDLSAALTSSAGAGQEQVVAFLLERGVKIDATESAALKAAVRADNPTMVEYLLAHGAHVDPPKSSLDSYGKVFQSALGLAASLHNTSMVERLLRHGADINLVQSSSPLTWAVSSRDLPMVDLLLARGVNPNRVSPDDETALIGLMRQSGNLSGWPKEAEKQQAILRREDELTVIVRRLVASGADVNYTSRICTTAYSEARIYHSEKMQALLRELGADPTRYDRCWERHKQGTTPGSEAKMQDAIATHTNQALIKQDFQALETLYAKVKNKTERTPSGIWKLAVFYNQLKAYPQHKRDTAYWADMGKMGQAWRTQFPASVAAQLFQVYLDWNRAVTYRGKDGYETLSAADRDLFTTSMLSANIALKNMKAQALNAHDPEWYRAMAVVLPYIADSKVRFDALVVEGLQQYPDYHEFYFSAAFYSQLQWSGSKTAIDRLAQATVNTAGATGKQEMYARIYWYLDQAVFEGKLFQRSQADWTRIRAGFDEMIATYPDAWNMNAYAYFACQAGDYGTMTRLLEHIDNQLVFSVWGKMGTFNYEECSRQKINAH